MKKIAVILIVLGMLVSSVGQALGSNALNCVVTGQKNNPACMQYFKVDQLIKDYVASIARQIHADRKNKESMAPIYYDQFYGKIARNRVKIGKLHKFESNLHRNKMVILCPAVKLKDTRLKVLKAAPPKNATIILNNLVNECNWIAAKK